MRSHLNLAPRPQICLIGSNGFVCTSLNELNSNLTNFIFGDIIGREFVKIVRGIQMMQKLKEENYPVRILVYILGLFIMTLGISMSVKSDLGVSPVSSIPYSIPF